MRVLARTLAHKHLRLHVRGGERMCNKDLRLHVRGEERRSLVRLFRHLGGVGRLAWLHGSEEDRRRIGLMDRGQADVVGARCCRMLWPVFGGAICFAADLYLNVLYMFAEPEDVRVAPLLPL